MCCDFLSAVMTLDCKRNKKSQEEPRKCQDKGVKGWKTLMDHTMRIQLRSEEVFGVLQAAFTHKQVLLDADFDAGFGVQPVKYAPEGVPLQEQRSQCSGVAPVKNLRIHWKVDKWQWRSVKGFLQSLAAPSWTRLVRRLEAVPVSAAHWLVRRLTSSCSWASAARKRRKNVSEMFIPQWHSALLVLVSVPLWC